MKIIYFFKYLYVFALTSYKIRLMFSYFFYYFPHNRYGVLLELTLRGDVPQKGISLGCQWITKNQAIQLFGLELVRILAVRLPSLTPIIHQLLWISLWSPRRICCALQVFLVSAARMLSRSQISVRIDKCISLFIFVL